MDLIILPYSIMRVCVLLIFCVSLALAKPHLNIKANTENESFAYVPDKNGNIYMANIEADLKAAPKFDSFTDVNLFVYTRNNPTNPDVVKNGNLPALANTNLIPWYPVKILIHGWIHDWDSEMNSLITDAFLNNLDVNVIVVDWSYGGSTILYPVASARVPQVGEFVAAVVDWLVDYGVSLNDVHLIGHSLGAHISGYAGRYVKSGSLPYITGLDPALPLWDLIISYKGITRKDADYVEIIHTDSGLLGLLNDVGHVDFYPNGGNLQPGCLGLSPCSHARAYKYFADSIDHEGFMGTKCGSVTQAVLGLCSGSKLHMGGSRPKSVTGVYYLKTNKNQPYWKG